MAISHRNGDARVCGASTIASQSFVTIDGQPWAVQGDGNTDGGGALIASQTFVTINGIPVILLGDTAAPDGLCPEPGGPHCAPAAAGGDPLVTVG